MKQGFDKEKLKQILDYLNVRVQNCYKALDQYDQYNVFGLKRACSVTLYELKLAETAKKRRELEAAMEEELREFEKEL